MRLFLGRKHFRYKVPAGLIIFTRSAIPEGWESFASANNRMIIGAGGTYLPGNSGGGNNPVTYSGSTGAGGIHGGGVNDRFPLNGGGTFTYIWDALTGSHQHAYVSAIFIPEKDTLSLIKAQKACHEIPAGGIVLSSKNQAGLDNIFTGENYLGVSAIPGHVNRSAYLPLASAGEHTHRGGTSTRTGTAQWYNEYEQSGGGHSDVLQLSVTDQLKTFLLSIWESAATAFDPLEGMIAMWESNIPPVGWDLCTGENGTVDLRDCFVRGCIGGHEAIASSGDNTVDIGALNGTVTHSAPHNHLSQSRPTTLIGMSDQHHGDNDWSHSHSYSLPAQTNVPWLPPYYALNFIQRRL
ncbi:MAG: hypothetical protein JEZ12_21610 [Desulfobacterium sp.]|nr:hypothetical protein [Desulfobacterium sp.]